MKKMVIGIVSVLMLTAVIGSVGVYAAGNGRGTGICQNVSSEQKVNYTDTDGDGVCDNKGTGTNYTDTDNDGVCDNYSERIRPQDGTGFQRGKGRGCGR